MAGACGHELKESPMSRFAGVVVAVFVCGCASPTPERRIVDEAADAYAQQVSEAVALALAAARVRDLVQGGE